MQRRNFLKILGIGATTAAIPTTALALTKSPETTAAISPNNNTALPVDELPDANERYRRGHDWLQPHQIPPTLQKLVDIHERYQVRAHNGDDYLGYHTKSESSTAWQQLADRVANDIEELAQACSLIVIWSGINPEFYRHPEGSRQHEPIVLEKLYVGYSP